MLATAAGPDLGRGEQGRDERDDGRADVDALRAMREGDEAAFGALARRHRVEPNVHCHRMLGSPEGAEGAVQETLLRAWRGREGIAGRVSFRAWL